jgi:hypothetical protein
MKTKAIGLLFLLSLSLGFVSCKKCVTCTYTYQNQAYSSGEQCGNKNFVEETKKVWQNNATAVGAVATCTED